MRDDNNVPDDRFFGQTSPPHVQKPADFFQRGLPRIFAIMIGIAWLAFLAWVIL